MPAARRRERLGYSSGGGGSSASSSGGGCIGGKRPRDNVNATSKSFSTSNNNAPASLNLDTGSSYQGEHLCFPVSLSLCDIFSL